LLTLAQPAQAIQRVLGYCIRVTAAVAHRSGQSPASSAEQRALSNNILALLDVVCAPTTLTCVGEAPSQQHVSAAVASGIISSPTALPVISPVFSDSAAASLTAIVAPSALGPALARKRTRATAAPLSDTAAPLNGVIAPSAPLVAFAAALSARTSEWCTPVHLATRGARLLVDATNALLVDPTLLQLWRAAATASPILLPEKAFSLFATAAAVHTIIVRQFARSQITAWLRRDSSTSVTPQLALRTSLRRSAAPTTAVKPTPPTTANSVAPPTASSSASKSRSARTASRSPARQRGGKRIKSRK
jgi:hypothetical protein